MRDGLLTRLYRLRNRRVRQLVLKLARRFDGGELTSKALRQIFGEHHGVTVGMYSYGCFAAERFPSGTTIGRYCSIATGVTVFNANHPLERRSLHPYFYNPQLGVVPQETIQRGRLTVGHDVWIGQNALIMPRVAQIGNGAAIGAGSVVTKDVPAYAVVGGNPTRIIRYRFSPEVQAELDASRWWEQPIEELARNLDDFLQPFDSANQRSRD